MTGRTMIELAALRGETELLLLGVPAQGNAVDRGQRRMARRVLQLIDARLEALDRIGCESEDMIAPELRA